VRLFLRLYLRHWDTAFRGREGSRQLVFRLKILAAVVISMLALASSSFAADNTKPSPYQGSAGNVQSEVKSNSAVLGSLPFTGLDLALIVGGGLVLVIAGLSVRRAAGRRAQT